MEEPKVDYRHIVAALCIALLALVLVPVGWLLDSTIGNLGRAIWVVGTIVLPLVLLALLVVCAQHSSGVRLEVPVIVETRRLSLSLIALIVAMILVSVMMWPLSNWPTQLFGGDGDGYNWRWQIWRMGQELKDGNIFPTSFDDAVAPYGVNLLLNDGYLAMFVGGIWNLFAKPTLAYNLTVATSIVANFFAARHLSLRIYPSQAVAILGAAVFVLSPSLTLRQLGHLNLCFAFVICLAASEGLRLFTEKPPRIWAPVIILTLSFLSSIYFFFISSFIYFLLLLFAFRSRRTRERQATQRWIIRQFAALSLLLVLISPFLYERVNFDSREARAGAPPASARVGEYMYYSADPRSFYVPAGDAIVELPLTTKLRSSTSPNTVENTVFPGFLTLFAVIAAIAFVPRWRWVIGGVWVVFVFLALGPTLIWGADQNVVPFFPKAVFESESTGPVEWLPYDLMTSLPGLSALRAPNRFAMALPVVGVMALAFAASEFHKRVSIGRTMKISTVIAAMVLTVPSLRTSNYWYETTSNSAEAQAFQQMRNDSRDVRVVVAGQNCLKTISMSNLQIEHSLPMVGCQTFSSAMPWYSGLQEYKSSPSLAAIQCEPGVFGFAPMDASLPSLEESEVLPHLLATLRIGYVVFPQKFVCDDPARTETIQRIMRTSTRVVLDSAKYLIVAT